MKKVMTFLSIVVILTVGVLLIEMLLQSLLT